MAASNRALPAIIAVAIVVVLLLIGGALWYSRGRGAGSERLGQINPNNPPVAGPLGVRQLPPAMAGGPGSAPSAGAPGISGVPGAPPATGAAGGPPPPGGLPGPPAGLPGPHGAPQGSGMPGPPSAPPIILRGGR